MVKTASQLWLDLNREKYTCAKCGFRTANKTHWERHCRSARHFFHTEIQPKCPRDCKIVIASFLPFTKLTQLGQLGLDAVQYATQAQIEWYDHRQIHLIRKFRAVPVDPRARTVFLGVRRGRNLQSLTFVI